MTVADVETGERAERREFFRTDSVRLIGLALATFVVLVLAFQRADVPSFVGWFFLVPLLLLVAAGTFHLPENVDRRLRRVTARVRDLDFLWFAAIACFAVSFAVAQVAMAMSENDSFWPIFAVWIGSILVTATVIARPLLAPLLDRRMVRAWAASHGWEILFVFGLTVAAFILRVVNLSSDPSPFSGDEAAMTAKAVSVLDGDIKDMFISSLQGHATFQYFVQAIFLKAFGVSIFSSRLISAVAGTLAVPVLYLFVRQIFGTALAAISAAYLTAYHISIHFSRLGLENIGDITFMTIVLYFVWRASRSGKVRDFASRA